MRRFSALAATGFLVSLPAWGAPPTSDADLLESTRKKETHYVHQEELDQQVRVWGDTAVVTALLWIQGTSPGGPIDYKLWFSDTYVRTKDGWRYVLGQASIPLPKAP